MTATQTSLRFRLRTNVSRRTFQQIIQPLDLNRLRQIPVHSRGAAAFLILSHGVRSQRYHDLVFIPVRLFHSDSGGRFQSIQFGHLHVHQHQIVVFECQCSQRFQSVPDDIDLVPALPIACR